jgi:hypothetical protein
MTAVLEFSILDSDPVKVSDRLDKAIGLIQVRSKMAIEGREERRALQDANAGVAIMKTTLANNPF